MPNGNGHSARLDSWKDIATFLRRDVRTAIRWEKTKRLPVHRVPGGKRQAVFAYTAELDAWLRREDPEELAAVPGMKPDSNGQANGMPEVVPFPRLFFRIKSGGAKLKYFALAGVVSAFALFGLRSRAFQPSFPARVDFTLNAVQAFDDKNQLLWSHIYPGTLDASLVGQRPLSSYSRVADFRGKGDREVLVIAPFRVEPNPGEAGQAEVDLFSSRGQLLWSHVPHARFSFGTHDLNGPWAPADLFVSSSAGRAQIWLAVNHLVWGNSFVVNLDPATGKDALRYVNTGTTRALSELKTSQGNFLLTGGFNNEGDTGSVAVINEAQSFAASPQSEGTKHKCKDCPPGDPDYYFEFPRSEINELEQVHEAAVIRLEVMGNQIEIRKNELLEWGGPQTHYTLRADRGLRVVSLRFDSLYDMLHRKLEREGRIRHRLEECPERLHPRPIRMWTPKGGWTEIKLEPSREGE